MVNQGITSNTLNPLIILFIISGIFALMLFIIGLLSFLLKRQVNLTEPITNKKFWSALSYIPTISTGLAICLFFTTGAGAFIQQSIPPPTPTIPAVKTDVLNVISPGFLTIGTSPTVPRQTFIDPGTNQSSGFDIDLITAIARHMGLEPRILPEEFTNLMSGLNSDKFDVVISAYTLNEEVKKNTNFIEYFTPEEILLALKQNLPKQYTEKTDLCGSSIGVLSNSTELQSLHDIDALCDEDNKMVIKPGQSTESVINLLLNKEVDVIYQDSPVSVHYQKKHGDAVTVVGKWPGIEQGILIHRDKMELFTTIKKGYEEVKKRDYCLLLQKWLWIETKDQKQPVPCTS